MAIKYIPILVPKENLHMKSRGSSFSPSWNANQHPTSGQFSNPRIIIYAPLIDCRHLYRWRTEGEWSGNGSTSTSHPTRGRVDPETAQYYADDDVGRINGSMTISCVETTYRFFLSRPREEVEVEETTTQHGSAFTVICTELMAL